MVCLCSEKLSEIGKLQIISTRTNRSLLFYYIKTVFIIVSASYAGTASDGKVLVVGENKNAVSALYEYGMSIGQEVAFEEISRTGEDHCPL